MKRNASLFEYLRNDEGNNLVTSRATSVNEVDAVDEETENTDSQRILKYSKDTDQTTKIDVSESNNGQSSTDH